MIKFGKLAIVALAISALVFGLSSCKKEDTAEQAGKEIDQKVEEAKQGVEKAGEAVEKKVVESEKRVEKAGKIMKDAAKEAIKK